MTDRGIPIRSKSPSFWLGGTRRGQGFVLLYPDKLATVRSPAELWGFFLGPLVLAANAYPFVYGWGALAAAARGYGLQFRVGWMLCTYERVLGAFRCLGGAGIF